MGTKLDEKELGRRASALVVCLCLIFVFLGGRLAQLQLLYGDYYNALADGNRVRIIPLRAARGAIYDRNGTLIVTSRPAYSVSIIVMNRQTAKSSAARLADLLGLDADEVVSKIERNSGRLHEPIRITSDIGPEIHTLLEEIKADLPGVVIDVEPVREYLHGKVASHAIGYVGEIRDSQIQDPRYEGYKMGEIIGQSGIELQYDRYLRGVDGGKQVEVDHKGRPTPRVLGKIEPEAGNDITLSLDLKLQRTIEEVLVAHLENLQKGQYKGAKAASMVVLDVKSGDVLALASVPSFDPNEFARGLTTKAFASLLNDPTRPLNHRAIAGVYAPGSTFKMATAIAALEEGKVTENEYINCQGYHPVVPTIKCFSKTGHGLVNLETSMQVSCNTYYSELGRRLGVDLMAKYARSLGLGVRTGIDLSGEAAGLMPTSEWKRNAFERKSPPWIREPQFLLSEHMMVGLGQAYDSFTPLQMAVYAATIANGGTRYQPRLLKKVTDQNGRVIHEEQPKIAETLQVSASTMSAVQRTMTKVTQPGGTAGGIFAGFPVAVAGKTGTAENPHGDDHAWFVGYAPASNPEIAFSVVIEQGGFGGASAGVVARRVLEHYFGFVEEPVEITE